MNTAKGVSRAKEIEATQEEQHSMMQAEQLLDGANNGEHDELDQASPQKQKPEEKQEVEQEYPNERAEYESSLIQQQRLRRDMENIEGRIEHGLEVSQEEREKLQAYKKGEFTAEVDEMKQRKADIEEITEPEEDQEHEQDEQSGDEFVDNPSDDVELSKPGIYGDKVVAKVDGQLRVLTPEQALSLVQKNLSADKRLEQASQERQRLQQWEQQLLQQQQIQQQQANQPPKTGVDKVSSAEIQSQAKKIIGLMEDGESDAASEELVKLLSSSQTPQQMVDPNAVAEQVKQQLKREAIANEANTVESKLRASGKYDDIFNDDAAYSAAARNVGYLKSQGHTGTFEEIMVEAMEMHRFTSGTGKPAPRKASVNQDDPRAQRKKTMQSSVNAASAPRKPAPQKQKADSPEERRAKLFAQAKNARNQ